MWLRFSRSHLFGIDGQGADESRIVAEQAKGRVASGVEHATDPARCVVVVDMARESSVCPRLEGFPAGVAVCSGEEVGKLVTC